MSIGVRIRFGLVRVRVRARAVGSSGHEDDGLEVDADGNPVSVRAFIRSRVCDTRVRIPIGKKHKYAAKHLLKTLKEEHPEFAGISFKQVKGQDVKDELLTIEMRLVLLSLLILLPFHSSMRV